VTVISATGLGFSYVAGRAALEGIDVSVVDGEALGVMGPNGSGKSTLLRILAGSARPSSGYANVAPSRRDKAVVLDHTPFAEALSGRQNARLQLAMRGVPAAEAGPAAERRLTELGLAGRARDPVSQYSTGMRRRLALAEALAASPALLLLDEPTLGLDLEGRSSLVRLIRDAVSAGRSAVLASNDPTFVASACDRVLLLNEGRAVAEGRPAALIAGLRRPVVIDVGVRHVGVRHGGSLSTGGLPDGIEPLPPSAGSLRFASHAGTAVLPALCEWMSAQGLDVRAIRIREPDLADVFLALAGVPLRVEDAAGGHGSA
jgi:ABC-type multidrug transport system ATPase subunit